ncbi:MAG: alpha/beta family hydrolase, partial [Candidatus Dormibacterales bacterium]
LLLFSFPLHRPGHPELGPRISHWPRIACPLLLLSGARDPFASAELLREASHLVPGARLVLYPGTGHQLGEYLEDALEEAAAFVRGLASGL